MVIYLRFVFINIIGSNDLSDTIMSYIESSLEDIKLRQRYVRLQIIKNIKYALSIISEDMFNSKFFLLCTKFSELVGKYISNHPRFKYEREISTIFKMVMREIFENEQLNYYFDHLVFNNNFLLLFLGMIIREINDTFVFGQRPVHMTKIESAFEKVMTQLDKYLSWYEIGTNITGEQICPSVSKFCQQN